jgi:predicted SAM-dependent methyltransferase
MKPVRVIKLNWGCGPCIAPGWINFDVRHLPGVDLRGDIRKGLPLADVSVDCVAAIHALQDLPWADTLCALREVRRVLKSGGVLRLAVPDLDKAIRAYIKDDARYFHVPDEHARSIGAKLITQIIWYGSVRTPMTFDFLREQLLCAAYSEVRRCDFGVTLSHFADLASLDNRRRESLFVEAIK